MSDKFSSSVPYEMYREQFVETIVSLLSEANDLGTGFCRISSEDSNTFVEIDKF